MNIALLTFHTNDGNYSYGKVTDENKQEYCNRYGYTFYNFTDNPDDDRDKTINPCWWKISYMKKVLPYHDWVMWSDADAMIMNFKIKIENIIDNNYNFLFSIYEGGLYKGVLNAGVYFVKNDIKSFNILDKLYDVRDKYRNPLWDNSALIDFYNNNLYQLKDISKGCPSKLFNSHNDAAIQQYHFTIGDFMIHLPGQTNREAIFKQLEKQIIY